jgi:hypothetical protein
MFQSYGHLPPEDGRTIRTQFRPNTSKKYSYYRLSQNAWQEDDIKLGVST